VCVRVHVLMCCVCMHACKMCSMHFFGVYRNVHCTRACVSVYMYIFLLRTCGGLFCACHVILCAATEEMAADKWSLVTRALYSPLEWAGCVLFTHGYFLDTVYTNLRGSGVSAVAAAAAAAAAVLRRPCAQTML
jgi:hypothetical protein